MFWHHTWELSPTGTCNTSNMTVTHTELCLSVHHAQIECNATANYMALTNTELCLFACHTQIMIICNATANCQGLLGQNTQAIRIWVMMWFFASDIVFHLHIKKKKKKSLKCLNMHPLVAKHHDENSLVIFQHEMLWWLWLQIIITARPENKF